MLLSLFFLSVATLTFEINLTRLFSVAQFYHFAFMIVSIALLGFGASGTILAIFPSLSQSKRVAAGELSQKIGVLALATGSSILVAYLFTNIVPFESFSIAWDRKQALILALHYLALALPFFFAGMAVGLLLAALPATAGKTYAVNLVGSALGCLLALLSPSWVGGEGTVTLSAGLAAFSSLFSFLRAQPLMPGNRPASLEDEGALAQPGLNVTRQRTMTNYRQAFLYLLAAALLIFCLMDLVLRMAGIPSFRIMELRLSPYKSLSYALQYPGSQIIFQRWNASSRVDVVSSAGIRSLPGLSYRYLDPPPPEDGLFIDGDDPTPILKPGANLEFAAYLPAAVAFQLRPEAEVLILEPRGGLDIHTALALGAHRVTAVESNSLVVLAASHAYDQPGVEVALETGRSYLRRTQRQFDIILISLATSFHPVRSGAYSLVEDYRYTVEAFRDALVRLKPDGLLVVTRWLQSPPSESLRTFALTVTAFEAMGEDPRPMIIAFRGYNTVTIVAKRQAFMASELKLMREFTASRAFDLIYAPDIQQDEVNRYNIMPEPLDAIAFSKLLETQPRQVFYDTYTYDVRPPTDDHPFFGHYFKWSQAGQVLSELGKTWQPFGGAGYFVILALLLLASLSAASLVLLPALAHRRFSHLQAGKRRSHRTTVFCLAYFGFIGLAFFLVEIPLLQRFILYLGHPSYAMATVLFSLLLFSGLGSHWAGRKPRLATRPLLAMLVALLLVLPLVLPLLFQVSLGLPLLLRLGITSLVLAPVGFLMGQPFPGGIRWMSEQGRRADLIPWVWAVNGAASVISAILAALLALTFGLSWVFWIGALCYAGAWGVMAAQIS